MPALSIVADAPWLKVHNQAVSCAAKLASAYRDLLEVLIEIDANQFYFQLEKPDLYTYCIESLLLPNHTAYDFVNVIRTSREVPELAQAILSGRTTVSKARRVCSVINQRNQKEWINLVCECPLRTIKKAVAIANPRAAVEESITYVSGEILELKFAVSEEWAELLRDTKDLMSQKKSRAVSTEEALFILMVEFKEKNDPVKRALKARLRAERKPTRETAQRSRYRPASVEHEIELRDGQQCGYVDQNGVRCSQKRWLQKHHIVAFSRGGRHATDNLETLCTGHHRMKHRT